MQSHKQLWNHWSWQNPPVAVIAGAMLHYQWDYLESKRKWCLFLEWLTGQEKNHSQIHSSCIQCCRTCHFLLLTCQLDQQLHWNLYSPDQANGLSDLGEVPTRKQRITCIQLYMFCSKLVIVNPLANSLRLILSLNYCITYRKRWVLYGHCDIGTQKHLP